MTTGVSGLCNTARLIQERNFKVALRQTESTFQAIEKTSGVLSEKVATELRTAFTELIKSLVAVIYNASNLARLKNMCLQYVESAACARINLNDGEHETERNRIEVVRKWCTDIQKDVDVFEQRSIALCEDAYNLLCAVWKELDNAFVPERFPIHVAPFSDTIDKKINRLEQELQRVYGNSLAGGPVLAELGDVLCEAGRWKAALGRYAAALGHLEQTGQCELAREVEKKIDDLKAQHST